MKILYLQIISCDNRSSGPLLSSAYNRHSFSFSPIALATGGGKAFPIILYAAVFLKPKVQSSENPWSLASILTVNLGTPLNSRRGGSFATPLPSTPNISHAFLALTGPRSGPPCFLEPPTRVGAILFAFSAHNVALSQQLEAIRSKRVSPTVGGVFKQGFGYEKLEFKSLPTPIIINLSLNCGTP